MIVQTTCKPCSLFTARLMLQLKHQRQRVHLRTSLTLLGIQLNKNTMEANITPERKQALLLKQAVLSLIQDLFFSCKLLPADRRFLHRFTDLSTKISKLCHHLPLYTKAKLHLQWWPDFLPGWSEKSLHSTTMQLHTDASGNQGWGPIGLVDGCKAKHILEEIIHHTHGITHLWHPLDQTKTLCFTMTTEQ